MWPPPDRRPSAAAAVAGAAALAAFAIPVARWPDAAVVALTAVALAVAWRDLPSGLLLWLGLTPVAIAPLLEVRNAAIYPGVAIGWGLLALWLARGGLASLRQRPTAILWPGVTLSLAAAAATALGVALPVADVALSRRLLVGAYTLGLWLLCFGAAGAASRALASRRALRALRAVVVATAALVLGRLWLPGPSYGTPWETLLLALAVGFVWAAWLFDPPRSIAVRIVGLLFVAAALYHAVVHQILHPHSGQWVAGWILVLAPLAVVTWVRSPRLSLALGGLAAAALAWRPDGIAQAVEIAASEGDFGRLQLWRDTLELTLARPFLGVGPGGFRDAAELLGRYPFVSTSAHGSYQQAAAEIGLIGLALLVWLLLRALAAGRAAWRRSQDPFLRAWAIGGAAGVAGVLAAATIGDYLLPAYHNAGYLTTVTTVVVWVVIGGLAAAGELADPDVPADESLGPRTEQPGGVPRPQEAPRIPTTAGSVRARIFRSSPSDHASTYSRSSSIRRA